MLTKLCIDKIKLIAVESREIELDFDQLLQNLLGVIGKLYQFLTL